jgi:YtcA family
MKTRIFRIVAAALALLVIAFVAVQLLGNHSPTVDILGSYFPAWMVCIVSGLTLTLIAYWIVQICNLKPYLGPAPLIYSCLMIIFTFATWILFYQN